MKITESKFRSIIRDEARRLYEGEFPEEKYGHSDLPFGQEPGPEPKPPRWPRGRGISETRAAYREAFDRYNEVWPQLVQVVKDLLQDDDAPGDLTAYVMSRKPELYDKLLELADGDDDFLDQDLEIIFEELGREIEDEWNMGEDDVEERRRLSGYYSDFIPEGHVNEARKKSKSVIKKSGKKASAGSVSVFKKAAAKAKGGEVKKKHAGFKAVKKSAEKWADDPAAAAQAATMVATGEPVVAKGEKRKKLKESSLHQIISQEITSLLKEGWNPFANFSEKYKSINNFDDVINELANEYFVSDYTRGSFSDYVKDANDFLYDEMMEIAGDEATLQGDLDDWYTEMEGEIRSGHADSAAMSDPYKFHGVSRSDFYPKPLPKRRY
jgi:hypothetical protein